MSATRVHAGFFVAVLAGAAMVFAQGAAAPPTALARAGQPATPAAQPARPRPAPPTRDPNTPGYVAATELPDGTVPPSDADGNFIFGPTHQAAPELAGPVENRNGAVHNMEIQSSHNKHYPATARDVDTFVTHDPHHAAKRFVQT